ncbi:MAG: hypothetical protein ABIP34_05475 [Rhodoferax sp.]|uniref:hypothetical protein n=1 Tax=Rhodoferax sp. TaxID=50421 RepID=UPI0032631EAF
MNIILSDIAVPHTKKASKGKPEQHFILHPFEVTRGKNVGLYEVLRAVPRPNGESKNRSTHVSLQQLAELLAHGLIDSHKLSLRMRPLTSRYTTRPPVKRPKMENIQPGSPFSNLVLAVPGNSRLSPDLARALLRIEVTHEI